MSCTMKIVLLCAVVACASGLAYDRAWFDNYFTPTQFNRPFPLPMRLPLSFSRSEQIVPFEVRLLQGGAPAPPPRRRPGYSPPSCKKRCNTFGHKDNAPCQCNAYCVEFGDCCPDYQRACLSCEGRCFSKYTQRAPCQCNRQCERFQNCCEDFTDECVSGSESSEARFYGALENRPLDDNSCVGRCDDPVDRTKPCQCNKSCTSYGDCCSDYNNVCGAGSCAGRCAQVGTDPTKPCQCNKPCTTYGDCCADYDTLCGSNGEVTDPELAALAEEILSLDVNNVAAHVTINLQGSTPAGGADNAPNPLLTIRPEAYIGSTMSKFMPLLDNYIAAVGTPEVVTAQEQQEEAAFLDAIFSTSIMKRAEEFLTTKGLVPAGTFREKFTEMWFGLYTRSGSTLGSSGFEHIFLGELKNGVSGFHGWAFFAQEEAKRNLNYNGYIGQLSLGTKGLMISHTFDWLTNKKPISSMFIGTSPEFDLSLFTVCWFARPNARCPITLNGNKLYIQTYDITYNGKKYVATAYPDNN